MPAPPSRRPAARTEPGATPPGDADRPDPQGRGSRERRHVVVVGGGMTGLAAAHALLTAGPALRVTVLEASAQVGGRLRLEEVGGLTVDAGAESVLARRPEAVELARAVGLGDELVAPATTSARVVSRGRLRPLPGGQVLGVPADLRALAASGVLATPELLRVPLDSWLPRTAVGADVSVGSLVGRRLGRAVVDRLVEPLLAGVYAGRADELSFAATLPQLWQRVAGEGGERSLLAAAGALTAAGRSRPGPVFAGLRGGLGRLPAAVAADVTARGGTVVTGTTVRALRPGPRGWVLETGPATRTGVAPSDELRADAVVLAVPGAAASRLLDGVSARASAELAHVDAASVALVTLVLPAGSLADPAAVGSGFLVPPVEGGLVKAATLSTAKWDWVREAAGGAVVLRASVGRHGDERALQRDDADLAAAVLDDLARRLPLTGRPLDVRVHRWGGALPQYAVGHPARVARVRAALAGHPTLAVAGAALDGVGVPACVASGRTAAAAVRAALGAGENGRHEQRPDERPHRA